MLQTEFSYKYNKLLNYFLLKLSDVFNLLLKYYLYKIKELLNTLLYLKYASNNLSKGRN